MNLYSHQDALTRQFPELSGKQLLASRLSLVSGLRLLTGMIHYQGSGGERGTHLPTWRLAVCLDCQHCFDSVLYERCTMCESRRIASIETAIKNWQRFSRAPSLV
jgi:hypothetical protein